MSKRLILRPQVYLDLDEIAAYIQKDNHQSAIRFLEQAESTFDSLVDMPGLGSPYALRKTTYQDLRSFPVRDFKNYLIFYQRTSEGIEILRVLHGARNVPSILRRGF